MLEPLALRTYFQLFEMAERILEHAAQFKLAFQIEEERFVVLSPTDGARQYLLGVTSSCWASAVMRSSVVRRLSCVSLVSIARASLTKGIA